ncbi:MAG: hypothetical protein II920_06000, partial [Clostridia bacterium]|nr:hypothetical protein [Clostridia bacterium]
PKSYVHAKQAFEKEIKALRKVESQDVFPISPTASEIEMDFAQNEPQIINEMLARMWKTYQEETVALKTRKGKAKHIQTYFDIVHLYDDLYYQENLKRIKKQYTQAKSKYGIEEIE